MYVPLVGLGPDQSPDATQPCVALLADQLIVELPPPWTDVGDADIVTIGATGVCEVVVVPPPVQVAVVKL